MIFRRYQIEWSAGARRFLEKSGDARLCQRIYRAVDGLRVNPRPPGCKKLQGRPDYRIRVGDYRILYRVFNHELVVLVVDVDNRKDVYR
jgi:mRNA interferase RelE/StbE